MNENEDRTKAPGDPEPAENEPSSPSDGYSRKRDFTKTPEPPPGEARPHGNVFVVQKHSARTLHYDLRLELNGVLKSWAVPKGPGTIPGDKRLAVRVEDHPLEYAQFEGVIPKGEYGGGTVMIWDRGVWVPENNPIDGLGKGALKFRLEGEKLKGRWALVRLKNVPEDKDEWLLIKEKDEGVERGGEAIEEMPLSVESGRGMEEIAGAPSALWSSEGPFDPSSVHGALPSRMPEILRPQLATLVGDPPSGDEWLHEIKYDGYRVLARIESGDVRLFTRAENDWTAKFPSVAGSLLEIPAKEAWLDGEVIFLKPDGTSSFGALQEALSAGRDRDLIYYVFDILFYNGYDLRNSRLADRKALAARLLDAITPKTPNIRFSDHVEGHGEAFFENACRLSLEGMISKHMDSFYRQGRGSSWVKVKCHKRQEFVVGGYSDSRGGRMGFGALLTGIYNPRGKLIYTGRVGTGFDEKSLADMRERIKGLKEVTPPFENPPTGLDAKDVHWVRPELVIEVEFAEWTRDGIIRHASFQGLREDKPAREVVFESPKSPEPLTEEKAEEVMPAFKVTTAPGKPRLTKPDQIFYPDRGLTKKDLADYYGSISALMLPHAAGRPLTLIRCPEGYDKDCFFQKRLEKSLIGIKPARIVEDGGVEAVYLTIDAPEGLTSLVQLGVLEIHTWGSRIDKVEYPDKVVFDIDPDPSVKWVNLVEAVILVREFLLELGLKSFVKSTGGKGLHVVVPLEPQSNWEEVKAFAKAIADYIARGLPGRFTSMMTMSRRTGKIFIDYMRNMRGATAIEVYSTRARPGAPVAVPLFWDELVDVRSDSFTVENLRERIKMLGKDPWEGYFEVKQAITYDMRKKLGL